MNDIISTKELYKSYGNTAVLKDVSISVKQGEIYGLVGKNGAGKTTLMKVLLGLVPKTKGEISLFGAGDEKSLRLQRRDIGAMIETPSFYPYMTAWDNLNYYRIQRGMKDTECIGRALKLVGLSGTGKKKFREFSLGMKQRLGLALALLHSPELLILDEPINGLDPEGIVEVRELLDNLNKNEGVTILISSHILGELSQLAQRYGFIDKGRLIKEGKLIVRRDRDIAKGTGTLLSPNDRKLGDQFSDSVVLTVYKVTGNKGWNGQKIWIPNIKLPGTAVYYSGDSTKK